MGRGNNDDDDGSGGGTDGGDGGAVATAERWNVCEYVRARACGVVFYVWRVYIV